MVIMRAVFVCHIRVIVEAGIVMREGPVAVAVGMDVGICVGREVPIKVDVIMAWRVDDVGMWLVIVWNVSVIVVMHVIVITMGERIVMRWHAGIVEMRRIEVLCDGTVCVIVVPVTMSIAVISVI